MKKRSKTLFLRLLFGIISCFIVYLLFLVLKDKEIDDIFPFLDKGIGYWEKTSKIITPRDNTASVVLLSDGNVLISGGKNEEEYLDSAEIYYPKENVFKTTENLTQKRRLHSSYLLPDGRVIIAGGKNVSKQGHTDDVEIFDPKTEKFSKYCTTTKRIDKNIYLNNGFICTENYCFNAISKTDLILPVDKYNYSRGFTSTLAPLDNNNFLITGGSYLPYKENKADKTINKIPAFKILDDVEKYNFKSNSFTTCGKLANPRIQHAVVKLPSDEILVVGGNTDKEKLDKKIFYKNIYPTTRKLARNQYYIYKGYLQEIEVFNPTDGTTKIVGKLNYAIGPHLFRPENDLILLKDRYIFVANGKGRRDELIDTKTWKIYPVKKMPKPRMTSSVPVKLNDDSILFIGMHVHKQLSYGYIFKLNIMEE